MVEAPTQNEGRQAKHSDKRSFSTPPRHGGASTASASSSPSVALCRALVPDSVPVPTQVAATTVPVDHGAEAVNIARLVKQNCPPCHAAPGAALEFASARAALSGDLQGVRWIYDCYLASTGFEYRNFGEGKKEVATIVTCDHTGPLLVSVWSPAVDVLKKIVNEHIPRRAN